MEMTIEYLIIIEKKTSEALFRLCDSIRAFNKFLQTETDIKIDKDRIIYKDLFDFSFDVKGGEVAGKEQRFFHVRLSTLHEQEESLAKFIELNRTIKNLIHKSGGQPETLWNDVSFLYSHKAYPYIHRIENLMRKLITYFMLTTVGKEWVVEASPSAVKEAIDKSKRKQYIDVLYQVDFKHLGDFLFKEYQNKNIVELYDRLDSVEVLEELTLEELRSFRARSNWDRYFSDIVDCEAAYLNKRWNRLYELRCMVAHNALIGKQDYESVVRIVNEVGDYLQRAFDNLDRIYVPDEDKERVAENVISNINAAYGEFIQLWKELETELSQIAVDTEIEAELNIGRRNLRQILELVKQNGLIDEDLYEEAKELSNFRNILVHDASLSLSEQEVSNYIRRLDNLVNTLENTSKPVAFHEECIKRIENFLNQQLDKQSKTTYKSKDGNIALTCSISKTHERGNQTFYWFGFHRHQKQFLEQTQKSYVAFGCGSEKNLVCIPFDRFSENLNYMSVTDRDNRYYWHVHIFQNENGLFLQRSGADSLDLSDFLLPHKNNL